MGHRRWLVAVGRKMGMGRKEVKHEDNRKEVERGEERGEDGECRMECGFRYEDGHEEEGREDEEYGR